MAIIHGKVRQLKSRLASADISSADLAAELEKIQLASERIAKIIRGLKSFSRNADTDPMELTNLRAVIDETLALCSERYQRLGVAIRVDCAADVLVECRSVQIAQALFNLIGNAFDAAYALPEKWVAVEVATDDRSVTLSVTDSGTGIAPDVAAKMMEPFFTTKAVGEGAGLGLSLSLGIARDHQGELRYVAAWPNTRFELQLPLRRSREERAAG